MAKYHFNGYETCIYSMKRKNAPWKVRSGCENPLRKFIGKGYELPYSTACITCKFYQKKEEGEQ